MVMVRNVIKEREWHVLMTECGVTMGRGCLVCGESAERDCLVSLLIFYGFEEIRRNGFVVF